MACWQKLDVPAKTHRPETNPEFRLIFPYLTATDGINPKLIVYLPQYGTIFRLQGEHSGDKLVDESFDFKEIFHG